MTPTLRPTKTGWSARVRMGQVAGKSHRPWLPMPAMKAGAAEDRRDRLQRLAEEYVRAGKSADADRPLRVCAMAPSGKAFDEAERAARQFLTETGAAPAGPRTFRDVAELWTSGDLHRLYPDDVPQKSETGRRADRTILSTFFPLLGNRAIAEITTEGTDAAKRLIPASVKEESTRAIYLTRLRSVFKLAMDPLGLITALPLRGKFVPRRRAGRDFWFLYPAEVRLLLACVEIPFEYRLLYGFLCHNGTRISETLRLTWTHIDWQAGVVRLEKSWTKTKRGRTWKLDPDVLRAFRRRYEDLGKPQGGLVFLRADGKPITRKRVTERFIDDVRLAGITRPELLASNADGRQLRPHDCRATFVTIARKVGRRVADGVEVVMTDRWIMDRTGHETLGVLGKYERMVRHAAELDLGWFAPLDETLYPEASGPTVARTKGGPSMDQSSENADKKAASDTRTWSAAAPHAPRKQPNSAAASRSVGTRKPFGPPSEGGVDQRLGAGVTADVTSRAPSQVDTVDTDDRAPRRSKAAPAGTRAHPPEESTGGAEEAHAGLSEDTLRRLLDLATRSREWGVVRELSVALEGLEQRRAPNVTRLDSARSKRGDR